MSVDLVKIAEIDEALKDNETAHLVIDENKVLSENIVKGFYMKTAELKEGVEVKIIVDEGVIIKKPVHLCFGITHGMKQKIKMDIEIRDEAKISILSHCILPKESKHIMEAKIHIGKKAEYNYIEKHIHGVEYIEVYSKAKIFIEEEGKLKTDFELLKGRIGLLDVDYEAKGERKSAIEMTTKARGIKNDVIKVKEIGYLNGEKSKGVLKSRIAVMNNAKAEIYNKMVANGAYSRGHVDCKEIIKDNGVATAIPVVEVSHPKAHVTHEAAIGSVDKKQLETLMAHGLSEDEAVELIIEGMMS